MRILSLLLAFLLICSQCFGALDSDITWEVRTDGASTGGGGFKTGASGTDYSQQAAAHLTITDLAIDAAQPTFVTSALTPFDAADIGNILNITAGVNFTTGRYQVRNVSGTTAILDRAAGTAGSTGGTAYLGGALASLENFATSGAGTMASDHIIYIKNGTYTATSTKDWSACDGVYNAPIKYIGYNATRGDNPTDANRPFLSVGAYTYTFGDYIIYSNIIHFGTASTLFTTGQSSLSNYCKFYNASTTADRKAYTCGNYSTIIISDCESTVGHAIQTNLGTNIYACYIHDSKNGVYPQNYSNHITWNVIEGCTNGIQFLGNYFGAFVANNTIYGCTSGIKGTNAGQVTYMNNIIDTCTTGAEWNVNGKSNYWDYNNFYNNTTDRTNVTAGSNDIARNPQFTNAANCDFSIGNNLIGMAYPGSFSSGSTVLCTGYLDIGAVQKSTGSTVSVGGTTSYAFTQ